MLIVFQLANTAVNGEGALGMLFALKIEYRIAGKGGRKGS